MQLNKFEDVYGEPTKPSDIDEDRKETKHLNNPKHLIKQVGVWD